MTNDILSKAFTTTRALELEYREAIHCFGRADRIRAGHAN